MKKKTGILFLTVALVFLALPRPLLAWDDWGYYDYDSYDYYSYDDYSYDDYSYSDYYSYPSYSYDSYDYSHDDYSYDDYYYEDYYPSYYSYDPGYYYTYDFYYQDYRDDYSYTPPASSPPPSPSPPPPCSRNSRPVAIASGDMDIEAGETVTFDGSRSYDPDGGTLTYSWDVDDRDGIQQNLTGPTPSYSGYTTPGIYIATLTVTDNCNATATDTVRVTVRRPAVLSVIKKVSDLDEWQVSHNTAKPLEVLTYQITIRNNGESAAHNVVLVDDYDQERVVMLATDGGSDDGNRLTWNLGEVSSQRSVTRTIQVKIKQGVSSGTEFRNEATVSADSLPTTSSHTQTTVNVPPASPSPVTPIVLAATKEAPPPQPQPEQKSQVLATQIAPATGRAFLPLAFGLISFGLSLTIIYIYLLRKKQIEEFKEGHYEVTN